MAAAYLTGAEIFLRMTGGILFYETGKYGVIFLLILGMYFKGASPKANLYWIYLMILIPGVVIASQSLTYDQVFRKIIAFNLSGPICLGVCAIYCYYKKIYMHHFDKVLLMLLLPIVANMAYLYFYTPSLIEIEWNSNSNLDASGGFGPNQISTILGLGSFLLIIRFLNINNKKTNIVDLLLLGVMSFRALATFSRGGVLTAIISTIAFVLILYFWQNHLNRNSLSLKIFLLVGMLLFSWIFTSFQTSGLIVDRYTNRNSSGNYKEDITTGRIALLATEFTAFSLNPVIGVGVGKAANLREEKSGKPSATHNEFGRLLSEHGLLGFFAIVILLLAPFLSWMKIRNNHYFLAFLCFWFFTVSHSAMRVALPAFVYGLALLYIVDEKKNPLYRKQSV